MMKYSVYWNNTLYARFAFYEHACLYLQAVTKRFAYVNPSDYTIKEETEVAYEDGKEEMKQN